MFEGILNYLSESYAHYFEIPIDGGALFSLILTLGLIYYVNRSYKLRNNIQEKIKQHKENPLRITTLLILLCIVFFSLVINVRKLFNASYVFLISDNYSVETLSVLIGWLLTSNLAITLFETFVISNEEKDGEIVGILDTTVKSILIGIITHLPKRDTKEATDYTLILIILVLSLFVLLEVKKRFFPKNKKK